MTEVILCFICNLEVDNNVSVQCFICGVKVHAHCIMNHYLTQLTDYWYCDECINLLPFHDVGNDDEEVWRINMNINSTSIFSGIDEAVIPALDLFNYTDYSYFNFEQGLDPDNNFYHNIICKCKYYTNDTLKYEIRENPGFSIIHFNSRSLVSNIDKVEMCLDELGWPFEVIAISETWFNDSVDLNVFLHGYQICHTARQNKRGGGVAIFIKDSIKFKKIDTLSCAIDNIMEIISIEIISKKRNIIISCIYKAPSVKQDDFNRELELLINNYKFTTKKVFICGDFNVDLLKHGDDKGIQEFVNIMFNIGLYPIISKPSRITRSTFTLIDNIFTNSFEEGLYSGLLLDDLSDHLPIFIVCRSKLNHINTKSSVSTRCMNIDKLNRLKDVLVGETWSEVYRKENVNEAYCCFLNRFLELFDKCCPVKSICSVKRRKTKPWLSNGLVNACKKKNVLYKKFLRKRSVSKEQKYKRYKNTLTKILRKCKKNYYDKLLNTYKGDTQKTWKTLNELITKKMQSNGYPPKFVHKGKIYDNKEEIANGFNDFFVNVGIELANKIPDIPDKSIYNYLTYRNECSMVLENVDEKEIISVVMQFQSKKSKDYNEINMFCLKYIIECIAKPLTYICNQSFITGIFPDEMKIAKVIPLFKAGEKDQFSNYRPVSILPQFSKILEKLFEKRLDNFINKYNLLVNSQYGFRTGRSTAMALTDLVENITSAIENKMHAIGVFIDLKKAFDTINHNLLLKKLDCYGVRGVVNDWISNYLSKRKQYVQVSECSSGFLNIKCGVPQGSILGPKLFILYINDICNLSDVVNFFLFADDTNILCKGHNIEVLSACVCEVLNELKIWFSVNRLSLNIDKTNFMLFSKRSCESNIIIKIDEHLINRVYNTKFLGVIIDSELNWKEQIRQVKSKVGKCLAILYNVKEILSVQSMKLLYNSLVFPYINYCLEVWGNTYQSNTHPIFVMQKKAIRVVYNSNFNAHTNALFINLNALKLEDLVDYKTILFMFKARNYLLPSNIQELFLDKRGNLCTRQEGNFQQVYVRTSLKSFCISIKGVKLWNSLNLDLKMCKSINKFKKRLKLEIINKYKQL